MSTSSNLLSQAALMLPELIVDSFAGGGGASEGIQVALGRGPDIAINHNPHAVACHQLNHRTTLHLCQDVLEVDPESVCAGRRVGLLWASPDCKHFSRAKSGRPVDAKIRGLAWAIAEWAKTVAPRVIVVENVPEFLTWGPLHRDGTINVAKKGYTFRKWVAQLRASGYQVEWKVLRASDYGTPTTRERLFVVARNDGNEIVWPEPTHGADEDLEAPVAASTCIDWTIIGHDIEEKELADSTLDRIEAGLDKFVMDADKRCVVRRPDGTLVAAWIARHYTGVVGRSANEPLSTVTAKDHHGLVCTELVEQGNAEDPATFELEHEGKFYVFGRTTHRMLTERELSNAMGFSAGHQMLGTVTAQKARIGNAVCPPLAAALVEANYIPDHGGVSLLDNARALVNDPETVGA